jgi:hypothetical protein
MKHQYLYYNGLISKRKTKINFVVIIKVLLFKLILLKNVLFYREIQKI